MAGHTKGPWYADGREVRGAGSWTIAHGFHTPDGAIERNARLIAAAPCLLEALQAVDLARTTDAAKDWKRATLLTDAAIAKATQP